MSGDSYIRNKLRLLTRIVLYCWDINYGNAIQKMTSVLFVLTWNNVSKTINILGEFSSIFLSFSYSLQNKLQRYMNSLPE